MKQIWNNKIALIVLAMIAGAALTWLILPAGDGGSDREETEEAASNTVWTCSMHPQIKKNEPGDCPICGMELIPEKEDDADDEIDPNAVRMSKTAMQLANIQTAEVSSSKSTKVTRLTGKVKADERLRYTQSSHIPGRIEQLEVNFTGEFVKKGQTIAHVYSPELVTAQEELFEARKSKESQPGMYRAATGKLRNLKLSEKQIDRILSSDKVIEHFPVTADVSGYVTKKLVNLGDYINRGEAVYEISDLSKVWVMFDVYEEDMNFIQKGDSIEYTIRSFPGETFTGTVAYIDPVIDAGMRVAKARVEANNPDMKLKPEMFASGVLTSELKVGEKSITVPKSAVMWTGKRSVVYVKNTTDRGVHFNLREVTLGAASNGSYIIESGLEEGEEIAVHGTFSIDAAAQLAGKPGMMNPEGSGRKMKSHDHGGSHSDHGSSGSGRDKSKPEREVETVSISQEADNELQPLFERYFDLKNTLVDDDFEGSKKAAVELRDVLKETDKSTFTGRARELWAEYEKEIKGALEHAHHRESIEELREDFRVASNVMIELSRAFNPKPGTLYVQYCPMADDDRGASWLSTEKRVANPYFGDMMLRCGSSKILTKENPQDK